MYVGSRQFILEFKQTYTRSVEMVQITQPIETRGWQWIEACRQIKSSIKAKAFLSFEIAVRCAADGFLNFAESPCRRLSKCTAFKKEKNRKSKIRRKKYWKFLLASFTLKTVKQNYSMLNYKKEKNILFSLEPLKIIVSLQWLRIN